MDPETQGEMASANGFCPVCGSEESGYFCRSCGTLLRGGEMVLCPRCHQIVPDGGFCNQCGQGLTGIALRLQQLALAGGDFWVTAGTPLAPTTPPASIAPDLLEPDESVTLADAELPDWLQELPAPSVPAGVEARIYPALRPIERERGTTGGNAFFIVAILLTFVLMMGLIFMALYVLLRGGG